MNKKMPNRMPKSVPTTGRTPEFLAKRYGFSSLKALIRDIPKNATVLDVGAGLSLLGHAVAAKRPDIKWINIDPYYKNPRYKLAAHDAPKNVKYLAEGVIDPSPELLKLKADRIFSYWVMPHLSIHSEEPVRRAVGVMWDWLKPNGQMRIGPDNPYRLRSLFRDARHLKIDKETAKALAQERVAKITRMATIARLWHVLQNDYLHSIQDRLVVMLTNNQMRRARRNIG